VVEHYLDTVGVVGSIPIAPTIQTVRDDGLGASVLSPSSLCPAQVGFPRGPSREQSSRRASLGEMVGQEMRVRLGDAAVAVTKDSPQQEEVRLHREEAARVRVSSLVLVYAPCAKSLRISPRASSYTPSAMRLPRPSGSLGIGSTADQLAKSIFQALSSFLLHSS
jgi:hypothetical protein